MSRSTRTSRVLRHCSAQGRVGAPPTQSLTISVAPGLGLKSRIVIVPLPGPRGTGVGCEVCAVEGGADGAVGVVPPAPLHAVRPASTISPLVTCDTFCMEHSGKMQATGACGCQTSVLFVAVPPAHRQVRGRYPRLENRVDSAS